MQVIILVVLPPTCGGGGYASEISPESYNQGSGYCVGDSMMGMKGFAVLEQMVVVVEVGCMEGTEVVVKVMSLQ